MTLPYIKTVTKPSGRVFRYLRLPGKALIRLPDAPPDSPEFLAAYAAARAAATPARRGVKAAIGSIAAAVCAYQQSDVFLALRRSTRGMRRAILAKIVDKAGAATLADLRPRHIEADLASLPPHVANNRRKTWRGFCAWAAATRLISSDPSVAVARRAIPKSHGFEPWTVEDVAAFRRHYLLASPERLAMELLFWTAARASDAVRLGPGMVDRDGWLVFRQQKTGGDVAVPFHRALPVCAIRILPDLESLHTAIAAQPERHLTWILTRFGAARSDKAFSAWFAAAARRAGVAKSAHGLRKARATALAEAGASAHQIGAWTGHESLVEVQRYARSADKRRILSAPDQEPIQNADWQPTPTQVATRQK